MRVVRLPEAKLIARFRPPYVCLTKIGGMVYKRIVVERESMRGAMSQSFLPLSYPRSAIPRETKGVVYTKPWVVELLLDLAGYLPEKNLVDALAIEPAAGEGAFLVQMVERLVTSCVRQKRPLLDCSASLVAYEIDEASAEAARTAVLGVLGKLDVPVKTAMKLAEGWVRTADFLFDAFRLPEVDFVVGNPPYIRLEDIPDETESLYRDAYPTMRGRADLYVAFFEAALRQLKPNAVCTYICADRWLLNQYGAELRRFVTNGFSVEAIVEMHNANAFEDDVSAYPAITSIRRAPQGRAVVASANPEVEESSGKELAAALLAAIHGKKAPRPRGLTMAVVESWFSGSDPWPCSSPARLALLRRLEEAFETLESEATGTKVGIGVATGCDSVFITSDKSLVEESRLLPLALAGDTISGHLKWSGHYLVDPWNCEGLVKLSEFPRFRAYVEKHQDALCRRHTAKKNASGWYKTIDRVTHSLSKKPKLYIPDIKDRFNPVLDTGETYPHHNLYFITSESWDLEVLGGLLLSAVGQFFIECYGVRMRGGYLRFQAQYLRRIRVPNPRKLTKGQSAKLVDAFRKRDRTLATEVAADIYGIDAKELEGTLGH